MIKKILLLATVSLCIIASNAFAATHTFDIPINNLSHDLAYYWGLSQSLKFGEVITSAYIEFKNINDWTIENNDYIYTDLLQDARYGTGVKTFSDNQAYGDYFKGKKYKFGEADRLFVYSDKNEYREKIWLNKKHTRYKWGPWINPPEDFTYNFDKKQLEELTSAMADGKFAFSFDPDCHYSDCGIQFCYETESKTPEPATMSLLGLGLAGLLRLRKRKI